MAKSAFNQLGKWKWSAFMALIVAMLVPDYIENKKMPDASLAVLLMICYQLKTSIILLQKILTAVQECAVRLLHIEYRTRMWYMCQWVGCSLVQAHSLLQKEHIIGTPMPPTIFKSWRYRPEGCPIWARDEAQVRLLWNPEDPADQAWLRLNSLCAMAKEKSIVHQHTDPQYQYLITEPGRLAIVNMLATLHDQISRTPMAQHDNLQKAAWITAAGGQDAVMSQDMNWLWDVSEY